MLADVTGDRRGRTAVDDAVIAIRDAMRVGTLATINTAFWADKL
ncbi:hypothetical protein [Mycolicibacterium gadium]|jgi:hypothetical protein